MDKLLVKEKSIVLLLDSSDDDKITWMLLYSRDTCRDVTFRFNQCIRSTPVGIRGVMTWIGLLVRNVDSWLLKSEWKWKCFVGAPGSE